MKQLFDILSYSCVVIAIALTALALLANQFGWSLYLEIFSHFQVQYFFITLVLAGISLLLRHTGLLIVLFCTAILSAQVIPWYLPSHLGHLPANYRVLVANLNFSNNDATQTLSLMAAEQPDLALFIEVGRTMVTQLDALKTEFPYSTYLAAADGIILYSKSPLSNIQLQQFGLHARESLVANLTVGENLLSLVAVHPLPPIEHRMFQSRNTLLADAEDYIKTQTEPVLLLGDLNITMWSPYYQALIQQTQLKNAREGFGIQATWPRLGSYYRLPTWFQWLIAPLQIPIDHCLVSPEIKVANIHTGIDTGSDHAPIVVDLVIPTA
ncbi:endonuclease exonuclease phosphatase [Leptolyngbya sp. Heron Island J]|uniref:endonuclease/exonuclease/phosphatase family protein n=1 Tax=Leptolyngbya sp. Heron Island J TaxID=1385935 RepID=UPI0003B94600|nr:endonuclease/exonuclease/phosphatase family protein [Leptolyngbya sp. Heron Island J]ESA32150.1 endonuclease exonuclease phosphatase [Leptolyngbya sp. Heron Island J]